LLLIALVGGCRTQPSREPPIEALRLSQLASQGDPARRASLRLCTDGLRADIAGRALPARSQYERALALDPTNPWAYLVLARQEVELGDPQRALEYVRQTEMLLRNEGAFSPGVEPHIEGLRGAALIASGRPGDEQLRRAAALSPAIWGDGRLDADELL
jgi:tetratricopeptide (TPR) repeat protein